MADGAAATLQGLPALGSASVAVLVVDDDRHCVEANLAACRLLGRSRKELVGRSVDDLLAPEMGERLEKVWGAFREGGGHAGPFSLAPGAASGQVDIGVTSNLLPGRHLLLLAPSGETLPGAPPPASVPNGNMAVGGSGWRRPTRREREVLRMLARGATDGAIARALELSPATVQTHVRNAKAKLGARTRAQAVALALDRGVISLG